MSKSFGMDLQVTCAIKPNLIYSTRKDFKLQGDYDLMFWHFQIKSFVKEGYKYIGSKNRTTEKCVRL